MKIPLELLHRICAYVVPESKEWEFDNPDPIPEKDVKTLYNFCLACKSFAGIGRIYLWRVLDFDPTRNAHTLLKILSGIAQRPTVASLVREIWCHEPWETESDFEYDRAHPLQALESTFSLLDRASVSSVVKGRIHEALKRGNADAFVALLLALCGNSRALYLPMPYLPESTLTMDIIREHETLQQLQTLYTAHWDTENSEPLEAFEPILEKQSLRRFYAKQVNFETFLPKRGFTVREIHLAMSIFDATGLEHLLQSFEMLESLHLEFSNLSANTMPLDFGRWGEVLEAHGKELTDLKVEIDEHTGAFEDIEGLPIFSLRATQLKRLALCLPALYSPPNGSMQQLTADERRQLEADDYLISILPSSLKELTLIELSEQRLEPSGRTQVEQWLRTSALQSESDNTILTVKDSEGEVHLKCASKDFYLQRCPW